MKATCPRLFEVEALRDGRLHGAELARFETHRSTCAACSREALALDRLASALRRAADVPSANELHVRRERTRLLAAFDATLMPATPASRKGLRLGLAAAALLAGLASAALIVSPWRSAARAPLAARVVDPVVIRADSTARWSRHTEERLDKIVLESGALSIRVERTHPERRLLVILPDGELEDIGTTFSVSADAGHTTRVTVQEGSVVLRLRGSAPIALGAGDAWTPPPAPVTAPSASASVPPSASATSAKPNFPARSPSAPAALESDAPPDIASAAFRAAMSAFNGGDHTGAAARFSAFVSAHPRDSRVEDAAYLRVLALHRSGNPAATRAAARDYLSRYPAGFRRAEVDALAR